jgi:hypothetical protein
LEELRKRLEENHVGCAEALAKKAAADKPNVMQTMMHSFAADSINRCLNRVEEDASGLTFQEWTPDVDTSRPPVAMLINSNELRAAGFKLKEVLSPALEAAARVCTRGATEI